MYNIVARGGETKMAVGREVPCDFREGLLLAPGVRMFSPAMRFTLFWIFAREDGGLKAQLLAAGFLTSVFRDAITPACPCRIMQSRTANR